MADIKGLLSSIESGKFDKTFSYIYGRENVAVARKRYTETVTGFTKTYPGYDEVELYSAPGRTEICGNHTDHQHGRVVAAGVNLDVIAVVAHTDNGVMRVKSEGYPEDVVELTDLAINKNDYNHSVSLLRGVAARFSELGYKIGGFTAYTTSTVLKGSGLSSSAAFETLLGTVMNYEYNNGNVPAVEIAKIGQFAERNYFGKPCGLLDQSASSVGSFVAMDFHDPEKPVIEKIPFDFSSSGFALCIVDTGGNHADLTGDYAAVPADMKTVANALGKDFLRDVEPEDFYKTLPSLHGKVTDRALLRAIHYFDEDARAEKAKDILKAGDFEEFKKIIIESGKSSFTYLQNVYTCKNPDEQGLSLALAVAEKMLRNVGAYRVHGGGFAGTIQAFVPNDLVDKFKTAMEGIFGEGHCYLLSIRPVGGIKVTENM